MSDDPHLRQAFTDLDSPDLALRAAALRRLRGHKEGRIIPKLIPLLQDENVMIRILSAQVLGMTGDERAVRCLLEALYDEDADVRVSAADALRNIGSRAAVKPLIDLLYDENADVRFAAVAALARIADPRAVFDLIHMLDNDDIPLAMMAAQALQQIGTTEALAAIQHLDDGESYNFEVPEAPLTPPSASADADDTLRSIPSDLLKEYLESEEAALSEQHQNAEPPSAESGAPAPVQFSAYAPREVMPNIWQPLHAYVYKLTAADAIAADAAEQLGDQSAGYREVARPAQTSIAEGALISAKPELPGFQFNPPSAQIAFYDDWQRFDFKLRAVSAPLDQAANGRITFTVEGVIVADLPLAVYVGSSPAPMVQPPPVTRPIYQSIFCSYSHKDTQIVERVEKVYKVLGMNFLRDVVSLKSGQDWDAQLFNLIDQADIFQLFWSSAAAQSQAVRKEWMHALQRKQAGFIRPVFWEQPLPPLPPELSPIHFAYEPELDEV